MAVPIAALLARWANFYVITGSSSAALMGLQFVVVALSTNARAQPNPQAFTVFNTPTIVHFATVLVLSALVNAPWPSTAAFSLAMGAVGAAGALYLAITLVRMRRQTAYRMVLEDRVWHAALPVLAYAALVAASAFVRRDPGGALFAVAAATLLLLFIGVHNAWDNATYVALQHLPHDDSSGSAGASSGE